MACRVHGKLGCLKNTERTTNRTGWGGAQTVTVQETYACSMVAFERPESGTAPVEVTCPHCADPVALKVVSAESMQTNMMVAALAIAGVVLGGGVLMYFSGYFEDDVGHSIAVGLLGVGGAGLVATMALGFLWPTVFDYQRDALRITRDLTRDLSSTAGFAGARGHKLIEVWVK